MSEFPDYKIEPSEHGRLSDNDTTPLRDEPAASPRIYISNAAEETGGWESDDAQAPTIIPKKEPDPECNELPENNYFEELLFSPRPIPKDLKTEEPVSSCVAAESTNLDNLTNGFTKREQLDDMDLETFTDTIVLDGETESPAESNLQFLLDRRAKLLEEHQHLLGEDKPRSPSSNKKRKKHKKEKTRRRRRSPDSEAEDGKKKSRRHNSSSPRDQGSRRSNNSQEKERYKEEPQYTGSSNNVQERSKAQTISVKPIYSINSDEGKRSHSFPRDQEFGVSNNGKFVEETKALDAGISENIENETNYKKLRNSSSRSPQRPSYVEFQRSEYSRLPNAIPRPVKCEELPDLEPLSLRDDEKGFIRLVNTSKLMEEIPEPPPRLLSYEEKRKLGIERAKLALATLELQSSKAVKNQFLMVNTFLKLPESTSYMTQGIFENPSPLQNNYNVIYKFNSICGTDINLAKWGLEALPARTAHLLNVFGFDVASLKKFEANSVIPQHAIKIRNLASDNAEVTVKTEDTKKKESGIFKNMSTQTTNESCLQNMGTQTNPIKEGPKNATFWQDPRFDIITLTQTQTNIMFGLQELTETMPNTMWAEQFYKALQNALYVKRMALKDPRLAKINTK